MPIWTRDSLTTLVISRILTSIYTNAISLSLHHDLHIYYYTTLFDNIACHFFSKLNFFQVV